jgi:hypothetical protein
MIEKMNVNVKNFALNDLINDPQNEDRVITGFAINPGTYHQIVEVQESEMQNAVDTINGAIVLKDHTNSVDTAVGRVFYSENKINPDTGSRGCYYQATIDNAETELLRKIDKNIIDSCSIGFTFEPVCKICGEPLEKCSHWVWDDGFGIVAKDINIHELSIVSVPADKNATVTSSAFADDIFSEDFMTIKNKKLGENKMDFESKYTELKSEFDTLKESSSKEVETLKSELATLKEDYETKLSNKVEENLLAKKDTEALQEKYEKLEEEYTKLKEEADKIYEEKLSGLRTEVTELNEKVSAGLTEEEIAEFSEKTLNRYAEMFNKIIEANPVKIQKQNNGNLQYEGEELEEDATSIEHLCHTVKTL